MLGVVDVDLFVPDLPFVFGEADRDARSALVSRLPAQGGTTASRCTPERLAHRARVEAVHAIGHLLGLSHCSDFRCAMFLSHTAGRRRPQGRRALPAAAAALGLP